MRRRPADGDPDQRLHLSPGRLVWLAGAMEFRTEQAQQRYDGIVGLARELVVGLDFDGTLSPIVEDPAAAVIHPDAPERPGGPGRRGARRGGDHRPAGAPGRRARPPRADRRPPAARRAPRGDGPVRPRAAGTPTSREFTSPEPPAGLRAFRDELPGLLREQGARRRAGGGEGAGRRGAHPPAPGRPGGVRPAGAGAGGGRRAARAAARAGPAGARGAQLRHAQGPGAAARPWRRTTPAGCCSSGTTSATSRRSRPPPGAARRGPCPACWCAPPRRSRRRLAELSDVVVAGPDGVVDLLAAAGPGGRGSPPDPPSRMLVSCAHGETAAYGRACSSRGAEGHGPLKPRQPVTARRLRSRPDVRGATRC